MTATRPPQGSWLKDAALPLQTIGALSAVVLVLNFSLEILALLVLNRAQQLLTAGLLVVLAGWALVEGLLLRRSNARLPRTDLLLLATFQLLVECGRLLVTLWGPKTGVSHSYGISVLESGPLFVFLPLYALLFLAIGRSVIASHLVEIISANEALVQSHDLLERLATTDVLTGLHNRRHFEKVAAVEMARSQRYGQPLSLIVLDIDHFKAINDRFGHPGGDRVLTEISTLVRRILRTSDTIARWGGEEFAILTPQCHGAEAAKVAEKLRAAIASGTFDGVGQVTSSFGVAAFVAGESLETWVKRADLALYEAKTGGRNTVRVASSTRAPPDGRASGV